MTALRAKGVRFAMDDFGSGHASIGTLRQFSFDKVKIDRSLIASDEHAVVRATIDLANALGIPVTAEGIETAEQAAFAREAGCELLQGYLLGRPMSFDQLLVHMGGAGATCAFGVTAAAKGSSATVATPMPRPAPMGRGSLPASCIWSASATAFRHPSPNRPVEWHRFDSFRPCLMHDLPDDVAGLKVMLIAAQAHQAARMSR